MFSLRLWLFIACTALGGCKSGLPTKPGAVALPSPGLTIRLLRGAPESPQLRALLPGELLAADEPLTVEVTVAQPAQVTVVMHSASGESEDLNSRNSFEPAPLAPHTPRFFVVPRRSPPGVRETELRLLVVASQGPLSAAARGLLRLPCGVAHDGGRGDRGTPETTPVPKEEPKEVKKEGSPGKKEEAQEKKDAPKEVKKSDDDKGKPGEGDKMGPAEAKLCASSAGIFSPLTVIPIVVSSK